MQIQLRNSNLQRRKKTKQKLSQTPSTSVQSQQALTSQDISNVQVHVDKNKKTVDIKISFKLLLLFPLSNYLHFFHFGMAAKNIYKKKKKYSPNSYTFPFQIYFFLSFLLSLYCNYFFSFTFFFTLILYVSLPHFIFYSKLLFFSFILKKNSSYSSTLYSHHPLNHHCTWSRASSLGSATPSLLYVYYC